MINTIIEYVNHYFKHKSNMYSDDFIRYCLVFKFLYEKYFTSKIEWNAILYKLFLERDSLVQTQIFSAIT